MVATGDFVLHLLTTLLRNQKKKILNFRSQFLKQSFFITQLELRHHVKFSEFHLLCLEHFTFQVQCIVLSKILTRTRSFLVGHYDRLENI